MEWEHQAQQYINMGCQKERSNIFFRCVGLAKRLAGEETLHSRRYQGVSIPPHPFLPTSLLFPTIGIEHTVRKKKVWPEPTGDR